MGTNVITREELHELVWSTPMIKVAEKFEVSGSYLARVCTELRVPRPERGCWAKLAAGKAPQRPAHSELEFERDRVVMGGVVKANGRANLRVTTFLRDARGLLVDRSQDVARAGKTDVDLLPALKAAIARAPPGRLGRHAPRPRGNGDGDGPGLQAGQVAGCAARSGRQRASRVRRRAPGTLQCRAARWRLSVPGFPGSRLGRRGRVGTANPALRGNSLPGVNRSRSRVGTVRPQGKQEVPGFPVVALHREGEHWECSPPSRRMTDLGGTVLPNFAKPANLPA